MLLNAWIYGWVPLVCQQGEPSREGLTYALADSAQKIWLLCYAPMLPLTGCYALG